MSAHWSYRFRVDINWTADPMGCIHDLRRYRGYRQLRHLHGHHRLHDLRVRSILSLCHRRQRMGARLPRRCPHTPRNPVLPKHTELFRPESSRIRVDDLILHLLCASRGGVCDLLEGTCAAQAESVCAAVECCEGGAWKRKEGQCIARTVWEQAQ